MSDNKKTMYGLSPFPESEDDGSVEPPEPEEEEVQQRPEGGLPGLDDELDSDGWDLSDDMLERVSGARPAAPAPSAEPARSQDAVDTSDEAESVPRSDTKREPQAGMQVDTSDEAESVPEAASGFGDGTILFSGAQLDEVRTEIAGHAAKEDSAEKRGDEPQLPSAEPAGDASSEVPSAEPTSGSDDDSHEVPEAPAALPKPSPEGGRPAAVSAPGGTMLLSASAIEAEMAAEAGEGDQNDQDDEEGTPPSAPVDSPVPPATAEATQPAAQSAAPMVDVSAADMSSMQPGPVQPAVTQAQPTSRPARPAGTSESGATGAASGGKILIALTLLVIALIAVAALIFILIGR